MRRLIEFSLRNRLFVIGGVLTIMGLGLAALMRIPFDAFPDLTGTRVEVITTAPGMAAEDVERLVTYPLESSLMGIQGANEVRSVSKFGLSLITVPFPDKMDIYFARTLCSNAWPTPTRCCRTGSRRRWGRCRRRWASCTSMS